MHSTPDTGVSYKQIKLTLHAFHTKHRCELQRNCIPHQTQEVQVDLLQDGSSGPCIPTKCCELSDNAN